MLMKLLKIFFSMRCDVTGAILRIEESCNGTNYCASTTYFLVMMLKGYLIVFVDDNSPIGIFSDDIISGIISYGTISGKPVVIRDFDKDFLNEHFHDISEV